MDAEYRAVFQPPTGAVSPNPWFVDFPAGDDEAAIEAAHAVRRPQNETLKRVVALDPITEWKPQRVVFEDGERLNRGWEEPIVQGSSAYAIFVSKLGLV